MNVTPQQLAAAERCYAEIIPIIQGYLGEAPHLQRLIDKFEGGSETLRLGGFLNREDHGEGEG